MKSIVFIFCLFISSTINANILKASDLEAACLSKDSDSNLCLLVMRVFMDGFTEGVARGVFSTYVYDKDIHPKYKSANLKDLMDNKLKPITSKAQCTNYVTSAMMRASFLKYIDKNPKMKGDNYRSVVYRALVEFHCINKF